MKKIGVVGVGSMGRPMAENLIKAGFDVRVCDIRDEALEPFRQKGVAVSARAAELADSDCVIVMVSSDADVVMATAGPGGLLGAIDRAKAPLVAIMSSVLPRTITNTATLLEMKNAVVVDAPVSGGPVRAADATISIMAAGSDEVFAKLEPVLNALGRPIFRCGPVGSAAGVKIVNNILGVANILLMNEATSIAARLGIDLRFLSGVMEVSSGRNSATQSFTGFRDLQAANTAEPEVTKRLLAILRKDLELGGFLAAETGVSTPILNAVSQATDDVDDDDLVARWKALSEAMSQY